jgi:hypothetical protein
MNARMLVMLDRAQPEPSCRFCRTTCYSSWNLHCNLFRNLSICSRNGYGAIYLKKHSASELYRPSDRRLSAKVLRTFTDRECHVVSARDSHGRILGFLERSRYYFFQVALQLYSQGLVVSFPDPLILRKSCSAGNRTRTSRSVARNSDR